MKRPDRFQLEGLTLQQLRYFNAVAEGETFADAADIIGISQSALSQGIARLEQVAGARLLERDGRRRRLTDTGALVAAYARRVLGESETLASDLDSHRDGSAGRLRVGMIDAAALYLFREQIADFQQTHSAAALSITVAASSVLEQRLVDFRDDVAILIGPTERVTAIPVLTEQMHLYGTGQDPNAGQWALYPSGSRTRDAIDLGLAARGIQTRVAVESANPAVLRELALLIGGFTVLPESVAAAALGLPRVESDVAARPIVAAVRSAAAPSTLVETFIAGLHM
ncbi:MAG: LysR family transcriptional regulator [bacterium]|nr:LysR family transcriptional regulator [bacterium]